MTDFLADNLQSTPKADVQQSQERNGSSSHTIPTDTLQCTQELYDRVANHLNIATFNQQTRYNQNTRHTPYGPGNHVWLYQPRVPRGKARTLTPYWNGPSVIVKRCSDVNYVIRKLGGRKETSLTTTALSLIPIVVHQYLPKTRSHAVHLQAHHLPALIRRNRTRANPSGRLWTRRHHLPMTKNNCANDTMRIAHDASSECQYVSTIIS